SVAQVQMQTRSRCTVVVLKPALAVLQKHSTKRRHNQVQRVRTAVRDDLLCMGAAQIAESSSTVGFRVAVQNLLPITASGNADAVVQSWNGSEVEHDGNDLVLTARLSHEAGHALLGVAAVDPFEPCGIAVELVQSFLGAVGAIQIRNPVVHAAMRV